MVNVLSVQGRGYTLSTLCFLLTMKVLSDLSRIGYKQISRYVFLIILLTLGLYTVPSSVYWVVPLCFATILYLIINGYRIRKVSGGLGKNKYLRQMIRILTAGVIAAFVTTFLYLVIWLAVGSNLIMEELDRVTGGSAIVSTDVGQHQMWAAQYYKYREPRTFLTSGGLGTMGYGLGAWNRSERGSFADECAVYNRQ